MTYENIDAAQIQLYIYVISFSLWTYDYSLTLGHLPLAILAMMSYCHFSSMISPDVCLASQKSVTWMVIICMCIARVILTTRVWVVWERGYNIAIFLSTSSVIIWISQFTIMVFWVETLEVAPVPPQIVPSGCALVLMLIKGYWAFSDGLDSGLYLVVYIDGILYYIYLFSLSTINLVMNVMLPHSFADLLSILQQIIHTVLACRMLLSIRECRRRTVWGDGLKGYDSNLTMDMDTLAFAQESTIDEDNPEIAVVGLCPPV